MSEELVSKVRGSRLAQDISEEECAVLAEITTVRTLPDDEVLIAEGAVDDSLYVMLSGKIGVTKQTAGDEDTTLHVLCAGEFAGQMGFVDGKEHTATLKALGGAEVLVLKREDLESRLETHPNLVYQVMRSVVRSGHEILRRMNNQYVELTNYISKTHGRY